MSGAPDAAPPGNRWDLLVGRWPAQPPAVSVIVTHYEQPEALARTLAALAAQTHPAARREVIVADDASAQPPHTPPDVRRVTMPRRGVGPGAARNAGAAVAGGEILCFLDADTAPEPDYLAELTRLPALAADAVTVGQRRHTTLPFGRPLSAAPAHELPAPGWLRRGYEETADLLHADDRSYRFVISAVLACRREFFTEVGPFAAFDTYGGEDWEWAHRAWRVGALLAHVPTAVAWHHGPDWAGRGEDATRRVVKNAETRRLAGLIGVTGSRGRGLRPRRAETVVRLGDAGTESQAYACVDGLLAALPQATIVVPQSRLALFADDGRVRGEGQDDDALAWPALQIDVPRPVEVDSVALRELGQEVRRDGVARLALTDGDAELLVIGDGRARARARRHEDRAALAGARRSGRGVVALLEAEPDLEAWVGGWANSRLPGGGCGS